MLAVRLPISARLEAVMPKWNQTVVPHSLSALAEPPPNVVCLVWCCGEIVDSVHWHRWPDITCFTDMESPGATPCKSSSSAVI